MSLFSLSTWSIFWAGWVKGIILGTWLLSWMSQGGHSEPLLLLTHAPMRKFLYNEFTQRNIVVLVCTEKFGAIAILTTVKPLGANISLNK